MIVNTAHGEFNCRDITRTERRKHYRKVKLAFTKQNAEELHDLCDEFAKIAFKDIDESLKGLSALQEDEVLIAIVCGYMGIDLEKQTGD
tara:strand:- start:150 stop:416 length:267 start_codon:yes stop_codon:yes gene_type:complete